MATDKLVAYCFHSRAEFPLSADVDDRHWRYIAPVVMDAGRRGEAIANHRTEIRARWTNKSLYFLFSGQYEELHAKPDSQQTRDTWGLWDFDVAEVFLAPNPNRPGHYFEFELSPAQEWIDLAVDKTDKAAGPKVDADWNSQFQVKTRVDPKAHRWQAEMKIPYASLAANSPGLASAPYIGQEMEVNFFRCQGKGETRRYLAWSPVGQDSFHNPAAFGRLRFVTK